MDYDVYDPLSTEWLLEGYFCCDLLAMIDIGQLSYLYTIIYIIGY